MSTFARRTCMLAVLVAAGGLLAAAPALAAERPHLVVFLIDDLSWRDCSIHGSLEFATPNMQRVSAEGMTLTHAFVASPSCAPSRAALLTGLSPVRNGAVFNHQAPRAELKKWPAYFQELGYETAAIGKVAHYAQVRDYGFDHVSHFTYHEDDCIDAAVDWLARRSSKQPLCLMVGTNWPHVPWPTETPYDPRSIEVPPVHVDTEATRAARTRYGAAVDNADRDLGRVFDAVRAHLPGDVLFLFTADHGVQFPFGKWNCTDDGLRTPLVAVWPGKIAAGSRSDALVSWIDILPTLVEAAGGAPPPVGRAEGTLSGKSFLPVLRGAHGAHRDHVIATHSGDGLMNYFPMRSVRTRDWRYVRNLAPEGEFHTHIDRAESRDGRAYWITWEERAKTDPAAAAIVDRYHRRPAEELYRVTDDPWEQRNLAGDPAHADMLAEMRATLDAWQQQDGDLGLATELAATDRMPPRRGAQANRPAEATRRRPNVIVILTDDQGSIDAGCYGSDDLATPALDALAARGVRFTQFYSAAPVCSPSRAGLLTGRYPVAAGVPRNCSSQAGGKGALPPDQVTMAEMFRAAGYATAHVGKWHLGYTPDTMPRAQGFDHSFGHMGGCIDNWSHFFYWSGPNTHDLYRNGQEVFHEGRYFPDLMVEEAARFLAANRERPFFLYFALNAPHYPYQGEAHWLRRFACLPYPRNLYAAFLASMDERVGRLMAVIENLQLRDETIIVYQSDNGFSTEERAHFGGGSSGPYRGAKSSLFEGGIRLPAVIAWPGHLPAGEVRHQMAHACDWLPTLAELADVPLPDSKLDGRSLTGVLRSAEAPSPHHVLHWQLGEGRGAQWAVREGDWKLIVNVADTSTSDGSRPRIEQFLANLADDVSETHDLSQQHPDRVIRLRKLHEQWLETTIEQ